MSSQTPSSDPQTPATPIIPPSSNFYDARYHLQIEANKEYFFLTIPGVIRLLEMLLAGLNFGTFGYFCTFYGNNSEDAIPPVFMANTKEAFFVIANCNTFLTAFAIIVASMISIRSHQAILESLFVFIFDFVQLFLVLSASIGLIILYLNNDAKKFYGSNLETRRGLTITGMLLVCLHLMGCIYDLGIYIRKTESQMHVTASSQALISRSNAERRRSSARNLS